MRVHGDAVMFWLVVVLAALTFGLVLMVLERR